MTPKEWAFVNDLLEAVAQKAYAAGKANENYKHLTLTRADKLLLKTQLEKYLRNRGDKR